MNASKIRVGLLGARGRMGQSISHLLASDYASQAILASQANRGDPLDDLLNVDTVIDFSSPSGMLTLARKCLEKEGDCPVFVVGSTGWKPGEQRILEELASVTAVLVSSNFSTGVLLLAEILKTSAPLFRRLGYTPAMVETHHRHKKDAPSGTALMLEKALAEEPGKPSLLIHSIRAGEVVGDHTVTFYGPADTITLSHHAMDRTIFARGAIEVALWLARKKRKQTSLHGLIGIENFFADLKAE